MCFGAKKAKHKRYFSKFTTVWLHCCSGSLHPHPNTCLFHYYLIVWTEDYPSFAVWGLSHQLVFARKWQLNSSGHKNLHFPYTNKLHCQLLEHKPSCCILVENKSCWSGNRNSSRMRKSFCFSRMLAALRKKREDYGIIIVTYLSRYLSKASFRSPVRLLSFRKSNASLVTNGLGANVINESISWTCY